jgi:BTB/POZ domain
VLFSCSPYFKDLLKDNHSQHPIFFFHDISYDILKAIIEYMYLGEVHITNENLKDFIRVAEALQIRGLSKDTSTTDDMMNDDEQDDENSGRKRNRSDEQVQGFSSTGKRLRIISEAALASALNDEDDEIGDDDVPHIRINSKRETNVQPKVESLEFLDDNSHLHSQPQTQPTASAKPAQNITYVNIENFVEKSSNNPVVTQQQQPTTVTRELSILNSRDNQRVIKFLFYSNLYRIHSSWNKSTTTTTTSTSTKYSGI